MTQEHTQPHTIFSLLGHFQTNFNLTTVMGRMFTLGCHPLPLLHSSSALFTPNLVDCGSSPAIYGLIGALLVELLNAWQSILRPWRQLLKLVILIIVSLAIGLLPYVDNFAHIGGFCFGILR